MRDVSATLPEVPMTTYAAVNQRLREFLFGVCAAAMLAVLAAVVFGVPLALWWLLDHVTAGWR